MVRRSVLALAALAVGVSVLTLAAAPAAADHVYSHRYVVLGRVIDDLGEPALRWTASATFSGVTPAGTCSLPPAPVPDTTAEGDFFLCYHVHAFSGGTVTVSGPGFSQSFNLDPNLRKTVVHVRLSSTWPTKDPGTVASFHTQYSVRGRVWQPEPGANLEGVPVNGIALANEAVSIGVAYNGGSDRGGQAATNNYGDYGTVLSLGTPLVDGTVQVTSHGFRAPSLSVDPEFMVSEVDVQLPPPPNQALEFLLNYYWAILVPAAVIVGGWYVLSRARPRRVARDVSRITGIGRSKAQRLREAGVGTVDRLAEASPKELAEATGLHVKETKRLVRKARDFLTAERGEAAVDDGDEA